MKPVNIAYGRKGKTINTPEHSVIVTPKEVLPLKEETTGITAAIRNPINSPSLQEMVKGKNRVVITHSDITRATPNDRILPILLQEIEKAGVTRDKITLINALGTHRPQTPVELRTMLGDYVFENYRCLQHDAWKDDELVTVGTTSSGNSIRLNRKVMEADLVIFTGFIEPHFFAGFSGGPKGALPALAGHESVLTNHGYDNINNPKATWGITDGNPIWEEMKEAALKINPLFLLNVTLNFKGEITGVFAGNIQKAHQKGCEFVRKSAMGAVDHAFDLVITTNSGYPLDQNLYQTVKGMQAAKSIVKPNGTIILASACEEGLPPGSSYANFLSRCNSPSDVLTELQKPGVSIQDQWQAQIQAQILNHAKVFVYSEGLSEREIKDSLLIPTHDIETTVAELNPRTICVLPYGPLTIAYIREHNG